MAIIKAINSRASIANVIRYITKKEKTESKLIGGYNCRYNHPLEDMKATKKAWNKTKGREYKHFVLSFSPDENITFDEAHKIAQELIENWNKFKGYEVCYATHKDKNHIHVHIVVNSVSFETGKKFGYSKKELQDFKNLSDTILLSHNKTICHKNEEITNFNIEGYKAIEKSISGNYKSWLLDIILKINSVRQSATSIENFIKLLSEKEIETTWSNTRKYITFKDINGNKVRDKKLSEIFKTEINKEVLLNEFETNNRRTELSRTAYIESEIRNRQSEQISAEIEYRKSREFQQNSTGNSISDTNRRFEENEHQSKKQPNKNKKRSYGFDR